MNGFLLEAKKISGIIVIDSIFAFKDAKASFARLDTKKRKRQSDVEVV